MTAGDLPLWIGSALGAIAIAVLLIRQARRRRKHRAAE
jgi:hypothetical protein